MEIDAVGTGRVGSAHLAHALGRWDIALLTIGAVIGSGIFLVPGQVALATQMNPLLAAAVWCVGALLSLCGAVTYAELARRYPEAGGLYVYIREGYGRVPALVFGWISLLVNVAGTVAALTAAAASILHESILGSIPAVAIAGALTLGLGMINLLPTRRSGELQGWTAALKLGCVCLFAVLLIVRAVTSDTGQVPSSIVPTTQPNLIVALVAVLWAFEGWQYVTCASGETRDAKRSMAFGLITGVATLAAAFLLTSLAVTLWLSPAELATSNNVVETALRKADLPVLANLVIVILPVAILSAAHATLLTGSRVVYAMSKDGLLPAALGHINVRTNIPSTAVVACTFIATTLAMLGSFETLLAYVIVTSWLFYGLAGGAIFRVGAATFRNLNLFVRGSALLFCAGAAGVMLFGLVSGPQSGRYGLGIAALAWILAMVWARRAARTSK
jgi:APA family basic amino acid/polyamine antiporter